MKYIAIRFALLATALLALAGCGASAPPPSPPPPPSVTVATPTMQVLTNYYESSGTVEAIEFVEIRPRVSGFLTEVTDQEGRFVDAGTPLFKIDPRPYEAALARADAEVAIREAERDLADVRLQRMQQAYEQSAASEMELLTARAAKAEADAAVDVAIANQRAAQLDLDFTNVAAPINGRVSAVNVDRGNLVGPSDATPLTTVVRSDPAYALFTVDEATLVRLTAQARANGRTASDEVEHPIELAIGSSDDFDHSGVITYAASLVDSASGTIQLRATFDNDDYVLIPGMFVRLRFPVGQPAEGLLVPELALGTDQRGQYVFVVDDDDIVEQRHVDVGLLVGDLREIRSGLAADDRVVIDGFVRCRQGIKVDARLATPPQSPELDESSISD